MFLGLNAINSDMQYFMTVNHWQKLDNTTKDIKLLVGQKYTFLYDHCKIFLVSLPSKDECLMLLAR